MSTSFPPPVLLQLPQPPPPPHNDTSSPSSVTIAIIVITSAVIASVCLYLLFRFLFNRFHDRSFSMPSTLRRLHSQPNRHVSPSSKLLDSLPLFTFSSVSGNLTGGGDCAVCLSKFRKRDRLRLLPLCCHAFHAPCIDAWIASNQTCPLCRSKVFPSPPAPEHISRVGSFHVEIGSISRREGAAVGEAQRSYAIGDSLEYVVDHDNGYEVSAESSTTITTSSSNSTVDKEYSAVGIPVPAPPPGEVLGRNSSWVIMDYIPILYRAVSLRSSGRFFSGSMRRTDQDLEANRVGEEISEMFRWFSGF